MNLQKRKINRLIGYDYSTPNAYFITVCTDKRRNLFWKSKLMKDVNVDDIELSVYGEIVFSVISDIEKYYSFVTVRCFTIMPNHIHLLLEINSAADGRPMTAPTGENNKCIKADDIGSKTPMTTPTIANVVNQLKGKVTKTAGIKIWQKGFYDHIIRDEKDFLSIWEYITNNTAKWFEDELYTE